MTDFNSYLHPKDRLGRWRDAAARAAEPHHTGSVPAAEVAALRHLRPGQSLVLPHGTRVRRDLGDLEGPRDFRTDLPRSTVARAEDAAALGVPELARPDLRAEFPAHLDARPPTTTHRVSTPHAYPGDAVAMSPGRAHRGKLPDGRYELHLTRGEAGLLADGLSDAADPYGDEPDPAYDFFSRVSGGGKSGERVKLTVSEDTLNAAMDAAGDLADPHGLEVPSDIERLSDKLHRAKYPPGVYESPGRAMTPHNASLGRAYAEAERLHREALHGHGDPAATRRRRDEAAAAIDRSMTANSNRAVAAAQSPGRAGRPRLTDEERRAHVRAAQAGPKPEAVGDIFTAINGAIATLRERRQAQASREASPGRAQPEPNFPEGGVSIVSGGYRMGPYGSWEQAADQLLRERRSGSKSAHARAGIVADRELSPEQARHLVELAARRALAVQEAAQRDREAIAAIVLRSA